MLKEINQKFLDAGMGRIKANLASNVKKGRMTQQKADAIYSLCVPCLTYDKFGDADMVIEAVIENLDLKQKIFADLERSCRPDCILSTNTSTIDITKVASKMRNPERILGAHFFSPAHVMQLFEIIRTDATPPQVLVDALGLSKQIKKTPVVVGNCTGFAVNRVFFPYTMSACLLADLGLDPYAIDNAIRMFGMPMGPFRLGDLVGHDVGVHVGQNFIDDFPLRVYESKLIPGLMAGGRMGDRRVVGVVGAVGRRPPRRTKGHAEEPVEPGGRPRRLGDLLRAPADAPPAVWRRQVARGLVPTGAGPQPRRPISASSARGGGRDAQIHMFASRTDRLERSLGSGGQQDGLEAEVPEAPHVRPDFA